MILFAILFGLLQVGSLVAIDVIGTLLAIGVVTFLFVWLRVRSRCPGRPGGRSLGGHRMRWA